jgi:hypothetical protein
MSGLPDMRQEESGRMSGLPDLQKDDKWGLPDRAGVETRERRPI